MSEWDGKNRRSPQPWTFDKKISIPDIITIIAASIAVLSAYYTLDKRISIVEERIIRVVADNSKQDEDRAEVRKEFLSTINRLSDKLDRLGDKLDRIVNRELRESGRRNGD